jgi:hypothetical protein
VYIPHVDLKLLTCTKSGARDFHDKLHIIGTGNLHLRKWSLEPYSNCFNKYV